MSNLVKWRNHNIEDVEVNLLLEALKQRYGYDFTGYARASLKRRLLDLVPRFGCAHLSELIQPLLYEESVAQTIINLISVPTSEFFRDPHVWAQVKQRILPQLASFPIIHIWQAGCGLGEETYTLAILLHEAGLTARTRIVTSDINPDFLAQAEQANWSKDRLELWTQNYLRAGGQARFADYFVERAGRILLAPQIKSSIQFVQHNLVTDEVFKEVQWVVCRNVLIYFGNQLQERVLDVLTRSLERGGYLMIGQAERLFDEQLQKLNIGALDLTHGLYRKNIWGE